MRRAYLRTAAYLLILLLAMALRFHRLDVQSFWNDEGNTARLVERSLALIIEGAAGDVHPPGYYLALHAWRSFTGESEFALRAYSAFLGILTVAVTAATARRVGGWLMALTAAVLIACHPLAVYYSQEARMYAQLGLVSALTLWCAMLLVQSFHRARRSYLGYGLGLALCIAWGLYTQYAYVLALAGLNLAFVLTIAHRALVRRGPRSSWLPLAWGWIVAHMVGGLFFLPWAPIALRATGWRPPDLTAAQAFDAMGGALLAGVTLPGNVPLLSWIAAGLLTLLALLVLFRGLGTRLRQAESFTDTHSGDKAGALFAGWGALGMALVPPALIALLGIYRPAYLKFLLMVIAPLAILLTLPLSRRLSHSSALRRRQTIRRALAVALLILLLPAQIQALHHLYYDPAFTRDDYRGIANYVADLARPGDAILLNAPNQWEVFTYYYRGEIPVYAAPYRPTESEAEAWVQTVVAQHAQGSSGRLFVLYWGDVESDPQRLIERTLAQQSFKVGDTWYNDVRLVLYGTGELVTAPTTRTEAVFDAGEADLHLSGYHLPTLEWRAGDVIPLTLFWRADVPPNERLKVFVHLLDSEGRLVAQADTEPQGGFAPTTVWTPDETVIDRYGIFLPMDLDVGTYTLVTGLYRLTGERLPVLQIDEGLTDDVLPLTSIEVVPALSGSSIPDG